MPIGCTIHSRVYCTRVVQYIHSVGFCIAYLQQGFSQDLKRRISNKRDPRFYA